MFENSKMKEPNIKNRNRLSKTERESDYFIVRGILNDGSEQVFQLNDFYCIKGLEVDTLSSFLYNELWDEFYQTSKDKPSNPVSSFYKYLPKKNMWEPLLLNRELEKHYDYKEYWEEVHQERVSELERVQV
jgi:hypothetical protein